VRFGDLRVDARQLSYAGEVHAWETVIWVNVRIRYNKLAKRQGIRQLCLAVAKDPKNLEDQKVHAWPAASIPDAATLIALAPRLRHDARAALAGEPVRVVVGAAADGDRVELVKAGIGDGFSDLAEGPRMVVIPAGESVMGRADGETVVHRVSIERPFAVCPFAVTRAEFDVFVRDTARDMTGGAHVWSWNDAAWQHAPEGSYRDPGFAQGDDHPVVCVSWHDAVAYAEWLSNRTGKPYRLLTEAEWEYAARAGTTTRFWWGDSISSDDANYFGFHDGRPPDPERAEQELRAWSARGVFSRLSDDYFGRDLRPRRHAQSTVPVTRYEPNPWGLHQVHGNVWEWVQDTWRDSYGGGPAYRSPWVDGVDSLRVIRGGFFAPIDLAAAARGRCEADRRGNLIGFRLARTL
jgi:formylglycine-generating enzyme required for sulfatase activity